MTDSDSNADASDTEDLHDDDIQDDAVIGTALRASLIVFVVLALPLIGLLDPPEHQEDSGGFDRGRGDASGRRGKSINSRFLSCLWSM